MGSTGSSKSGALWRHDSAELGADLEVREGIRADHAAIRTDIGIVQT
jgi:hypothetical protein